MKQKKIVPLLLATLLTGCAASSVVDSNGHTDKVVWANPNDITFDNDQGTYPNVANVETVRSNMTRDQLYYLLGRPQFTEGFGSRAWQYIFNFNTPGRGENGVTRCQYQILFDSNKLAQEFYSRPLTAGNSVCPAMGKVKKVYTLSADALFKFAGSSLADIPQKGKVQLNDLATKLRELDAGNAINVVGYTDKIGSDAANMKLSQARANTVRSYLISEGVPATKITAIGRGENYPVVQCSDSLPREELIKCLQPNRRVDVEIDGKKQLKVTR